MFVTVLTYQFVQVIRTRLKRHGIKEGGHVEGNWLDKGTSETTFRQGNGKVPHIRKASVAEPEHERLQKCLGLEGNPGGIQKYVVG